MACVNSSPPQDLRPADHLSSLLTLVTCDSNSEAKSPVFGMPFVDVILTAYEDDHYQYDCQRTGVYKSA